MCGLKTNNRKFYRILSLTEVSKLPLVLFVRLGLVNFFLVFDFVLWVFWFFFSVFANFCHFITLIKGQDLFFLPENSLKEGEAPPSQ